MKTTLGTTKFSAIYDRFLGKITDDMYMELTPQDTIRDLQRLLLNTLPEFEFPRKNLYNYTINTKVVNESDITPEDFVLGVVWQELPEDNETPAQVIIDNSTFNNILTPEEMNILAILMMIGWVQRQVTSIEHTRMKYSGQDFKMTSQANHLQKLLSLLSEVQRQSHHMQRLYKRRRSGRFSNIYRSTWKENFSRSVFDDDTSIWQKHRNKRTRNKKESNTTDQSNLEVDSNAGE